MVYIDPHIIINQSELSLRERIGHGTYGEVYRARWGEQEVAVKKVFHINGAAQEATKQLAEELLTLIKVRHPLVLIYYGICVISDDELWIVMEYADGGSIRSIFNDKRVQEGIKTNWMLDVIRGVACLHERKVIHKAISSSNFLIVNGVAKVADFGMETARNIHRNVVKTPPGGARWLAPECTPDQQCVFNDKSDIFALGMVLSEVANDTLPFAELTGEEEVLKAIKNKKRPKIAESCPPNHKEWIAKCWDESAQNRPSAADVLKAFEPATPSLRPALQVTFHPHKAGKQRKYFKINWDELRGQMKPEHIQISNTPPPYPLEGTPPYAPTHIERYTISRPSKNAHMIGTENYAPRLFHKVEKYFNHFYVPSDPSLEAVLESVDLYNNPVLEQQFEHEDELFNKQYEGLKEFRKHDDLALNLDYLSTLLTSSNLIYEENSNPIAAWHGAPNDKLESIFWYGLLNINSTDAGYYGKGIYFTHLPGYGELYANDMEAAKGKSSLLLCWVLIGRPFALTKVRLGGQATPEYTSHYVLVTKKEVTQGDCASRKDFEVLEGKSDFFPLREGEVRMGDEIVVFRSEQILPRYVVHYSLVKKITSTPVNEPNTKITSTPTPPSPSTSANKKATNSPLITSVEKPKLVSSKAMTGSRK